MSELWLRYVRCDDAPALQHSCWTTSSLSSIEGYLNRLLIRQERGHTWAMVAVMDGEVIGFGQLGRWGRRCEISDLIVAEAYRGNGVGTTIIHRLLEIACQQGITEVEIGAAVSNPRALTLYKSLGFCEIRQVMMDLGHGPEPVVYLRKYLPTLESK
jgi:ribosomal protein S18 acetylase RimI-like enzyme